MTIRSAAPFAVLLLVTVVGCRDKRVDAFEARVAQLEGRLASLEARVASSASAPAPSASAAVVPKLKCSRAKVACVDAWEKAMPGAEAARKAAGVYESGPGTYPWNQPGLYDLPKAANEACSTKGALKIRETGRAVKDAPARPEIATAKQASVDAFEACRDVDP